jgi:hypothetical protein
MTRLTRPCRLRWLVTKSKPAMEQIVDKTVSLPGQLWIVAWPLIAQERVDAVEFVP